MLSNAVVGGEVNFNLNYTFFLKQYYYFMSLSFSCRYSIAVKVAM